jgi:hypothetical protein
MTVDRHEAVSSVFLIGSSRPPQFVILWNDHFSGLHLNDNQRASQFGRCGSACYLFLNHLSRGNRREADDEENLQFT